MAARRLLKKIKSKRNADDDHLSDSNTPSNIYSIEENFTDPDENEETYDNEKSDNNEVTDENEETEEAKESDDNDESDDNEEVDDDEEPHETYVPDDPLSEPENEIHSEDETETDDQDIDNVVIERKNGSLIEYVYSLSLKAFLIFWIVTFNISRSAADVLLKYMKHREESDMGSSDLPKNIKTLLNTPRETSTLKDVPPGSYVHFGLIKGLIYKQKEINYKKLHELTEGIILLELNWDGGEAAKSSKSTIWPIQAKIVDVSMLPMFVGLYHGPQKPVNFDEYLMPLIEELRPYIVDKKNFIINGLSFSLKIRRCILDNPAKCATFGLWASNSKNGCSRCFVVGKHDKGIKKIKWHLFQI